MSRKKVAYTDSPEHALGIDEDRRDELRELVKEAFLSKPSMSDTYLELVEKVEDPIELVLCGSYMAVIALKVEKLLSNPLEMIRSITGETQA